MSDFRLDWHEIGNGEWHAGGMGRSFIILRDEQDRFTLDVHEGDHAPRELGEFGSLEGAQARAHKEFRGRGELDPLLNRLRRVHPEREVAPC